MPYILRPEESSKAYHKNWARLIQKIYEVDLFTCPRCHEPMRVISFIEDQNLIKKILKHLGLWEKKPRPPPKAAGLPKSPEHHIDYSRRGVDSCGSEATSQLPVSDMWLYVDPEYPPRPSFPDFSKSKGEPGDKYAFNFTAFASISAGPPYLQSPAVHTSWQIKNPFQLAHIGGRQTSTTCWYEFTLDPQGKNPI